MTTLEEMLARAHSFSDMRIAQIKALVNEANVDTDRATLHAGKIEHECLADYPREYRIAVFLSGLMANLICEDD